MTYPSDDWASIFFNTEREFAGYGQGILRSFDAETFENTVEYRGTLLTNLPVMTGTDALSFQADDVVLLMKWRPTGAKGLGSYWIAGRPVVPGAGRATEAISFMTSTLVNAISAQVFADRIHTAAIATQQGTTSLTFTDLATPGPTVSDVEITSGKAVVFVCAGFFCPVSTPGPPNVDGGWVGVQVSGATSVAPVELESLHMQQTISGAAGTGTSNQMRAASVHVFNTLNPGAHTFTAKYRRVAGTGGNPQFFNREIVVIAL